MNRKSKKHKQAKARIAKLDTLIQRIYEDNVEGKISDDRFAKLSGNYETEQAQLQSRVEELQRFLDDAKERA